MQLFTDTQVGKAMPFFISFSFLKQTLVSFRISWSPNSQISSTLAPTVHFSITCLRTPEWERIQIEIQSFLAYLVDRKSLLHGQYSLGNVDWTCKEWCKWIHLRFTMSPAILYLVTTRSSAIVFSSSAIVFYPSWTADEEGRTESLVWIQFI